MFRKKTTKIKVRVLGLPNTKGVPIRVKVYGQGYIRG